MLLDKPLVEGWGEIVFFPLDAAAVVLHVQYIAGNCKRSRIVWP